MADRIAELAQLLVQDNAVLFVGAGLRQDGEHASLLEQMASALAQQIDYKRPDISFAAVARDYQVLKGRMALVQALRAEIERWGVQPTATHQLIADVLLPRAKVITTRFDHVLELALDEQNKSFVSIVRETDVPFFDETKVVLIKVLGDINDPDSLVITEDDLDAFIDRLPTVSDVVRAFFATKTLIFLGYNLNDPQFKRFYSQITRKLAAYRRPAFAVVPADMDEVERQYWRQQNIELYESDAAVFLQALADVMPEASHQPAPALIARVALPSPDRLPPFPYKGLQSFALADAAIFAGRDDDSRRLANRVIAHRVTVLYGPSGVGKTSLLQAGAGRHLAAAGALVVPCAPEPGKPLAESLRASLTIAGQAVALTAPTDDDLNAWLRGWAQALAAPVVLALDPFESLFLAYDEVAQKEALTLLHTLIEDRDLDLRFVFVLREDFLGRLQGLESQLPGVFDVRFRVQGLSQEAARAAIEQPAQRFDASWEPELVQQVLADLASESGLFDPPPLQILCERLFRAGFEKAGGRSKGLRITMALFDSLGKTPGILGDYLDDVLKSVEPEQQTTLRLLLAALVGSGLVRQRLTVEDLVQVVDIDAVEAVRMLDDLAARGLVRRYEVDRGRKARARLEELGPTAPLLAIAYELANDYVAERVALGYGEAFWAAQRAREIVRNALPDWQQRDRLLVASDLRVVAAQEGQIRFTPDASALIYASAVAWDSEPLRWERHLPGPARRAVLLRLLASTEPDVRGRACAQLAGFADQEVADRLVAVAIGDAAPIVRATAAIAIAAGVDQHGGQLVLAPLVAGAQDASRRAAALAALVIVRDRAPASDPSIPPALRGPVRRQVWKQRWRRGWPDIRAATLRGANGGFWGLGLGLALLLALDRLDEFLIGQASWRVLAVLILEGIPLMGLVGALMVGGAAFAARGALTLQDRRQPRSAWVAAVAFGALLSGVGMTLVALVLVGTPSLARFFLAGLLLGLSLLGIGLASAQQGRWVRLALALVAGVLGFVVISSLGLVAAYLDWWQLVLLGVFSGLGIFWGLGWAGITQEEVTP